MSIETAEDRARQAFYARYDKALSSLSPEVRQLCCLGGFTEAADGSWSMRDSLGNVIAKHRSSESIEAEAAAAAAAAVKAGQYRSAQKTAPSNRRLSDVALGDFLIRLIGEEFIVPLAARIRSIEETHKHVKSLDQAGVIDAQVIDELANTIQRVDALEKILEGRGIRFMGRWNRDVDFQNGDIVSHGAALWIAKRATRETPGVGLDWQRMLKADHRGSFKTGDDE
jgi:hypothetical protein